MPSVLFVLGGLGGGGGGSGQGIQAEGRDGGERSYRGRDTPPIDTLNVKALR